VSPARAVEIACAVLSALAEAHRVGVLHRDVKPSNVLFDAAGAARLADFGVARLDDGSRTATAGAIGTLAYMAPEQRDGRPASTASDVYGAGVLLAELLTGERRLGSSAAEPRARPSERNPDLGPAHDAIVARLCAEDPDDRPSALEARRALEALGWPDRVAVAPARVEPSEAAAAVRPVTRFEALGGGRFRDAWLGREVLAIPLDDASLALARALARAGHPALPSILEADLDAGTIWIAAARGPSLTEAPRALSAAEVARLRDAITALHAAGGGHGSLDAAHLHGAAGDLQLAYPALPADARAAERDRAALAALEAAASPCADRAASC
jgi:serine/threonine-protein kinase